MEIVPAADTIRHVIASNTLLTANHPWYIDGWVYVANEATLRMEAGAVIRILPTAIDKDNGRHSGGLIITRGARIYAAGTATLPVRIITDSSVNNGASGIIVLGKAPVEKKELMADNPEALSSSNLAYGGNASNDSSGVIKHLNIDYYPATGNGFKGGLLLLGTGRKTVTGNVILRELPVKKHALKTAGLR
ncbi:MAG TPA: hypothetical protein VM802_06130 [Chitinophaga sp.]|uniref:hypothetical protein n=1 Tax=Chitinophaga sp. TaxID=1869181 RepID=UPI002CFAACB6|nr:hypothetical protein [Chitinophaga sp.]HVI44424.1 hypothetical protein [Chitinophaga sp.]